eukprot:58448-Lingulodinium_polyedra.AAC.1
MSFADLEPSSCGCSRSLQTLHFSSKAGSSTGRCGKESEATLVSGPTPAMAPEQVPSWRTSDHTM